jgi:inorganic pyrophosphatase
VILTLEPTYPGVRVRARPIGVFWILTGHGREAKLVCVPQGEPAYAGVQELSQLPEHQLSEIATGETAGDDVAHPERRVERPFEIPMPAPTATT